MRELPILFSTPMVKAIEDNRKKMTRRTSGLEKVNLEPDNWEYIQFINEVNTKTLVGQLYVCFRYKSWVIQSFKPRYQEGDHVWVKETWRKFDICKNIIMYKADRDRPNEFKWKSSLYMRKEYARTWLECTGVRCERLRDISEQDAINEGIQIIEDNEAYFDYEFNGKNGSYATAKGSFFSLWKKINGNESLDLNPWVFVYEFKRIQDNDKSTGNSNN